MNVPKMLSVDPPVQDSHTASVNFLRIDSGVSCRLVAELRQQAVQLVERCIGDHDLAGLALR